MAKKIISVNSEKEKKVSKVKKSIPEKTEKKSAGKSRQTIDKKIIDVLKDFPIGIAVFDEKTKKYVYINEACKKFYKHETDDTDFLSELLPPDEIIENKIISITSCNKDKKKAELKIFPLYSGNRKSKYKLLTIKDFTDVARLKKDYQTKESELKNLSDNLNRLTEEENKIRKNATELEMLLNELQEETKSGFFKYDIEKKHFEWTYGIYTLFDYEPGKEELTEEKILAKLDRESLKTLNHFREDIKKKSDVSFAIKVNGKEAKYLKVILQKISDADGRQIINGKILDVTEKINYEKKSKEFTSALENENQIKEKISTILEDNLKNPLIAILRQNSELADNFQFLGREEIFSGIKNLNKTLKEIFISSDTLLEWTKLHSGKTQYNPENVNLCEIIKDAAIKQKSIFKDKDINYSFEVNDAINVYADKSMLKTIIDNLLSNSYKFTEPGGSIIITAETGDSRCEISVSDTGVGISSDDIKKLFNLRQSFSTPGTGNEKGIGLGLILCREYLALHNSELKVISETGIGTTFSFSLKKS